MQKKTFIITFLNIALMLLMVSSSYSQLQQPGFECGDMNISSLPPTPFGMGLAKPMKTLPVNDETKYFRVLMVFVEFDNETDLSSHWTAGQLPDYAGDLFAQQKEFGLNAYEDYLVSDYFNKISNDQFDVIGDVYRVELSHDIGFYNNIAEAETEVFSILDNVMNIDWNLYDQWSWNETNQEYEKTQDDYIDMAYIQYRKVDPFGYNWGG